MTTEHRIPAPPHITLPIPTAAEVASLAQYLVESAQRIGARVTITVNHVDLAATPDSEPGAIVAAYEAEVARRHLRPQFRVERSNWPAFADPSLKATRIAITPVDKKAAWSVSATRDVRRASERQTAYEWDISTSGLQWAAPADARTYAAAILEAARLIEEE